MNKSIESLFAANRAWSEQMRQIDPDFFGKLARQQTPEYLWIGCSDSRVPANQITGLAPGEVFVHRNIGNVVVQTDLNCLSVIEFAVAQLHVKHIMVVGHYGCSGVATVLAGKRVGVADNWLRQIDNIRIKHASLLDGLDDEASLNRLCELNVIEQVVNVCRTTVLQDAWQRGQDLAVHGWVYGLKDGLVRDLDISVSTADGWPASYGAAMARLVSAKG